MNYPVCLVDIHTQTETYSVSLDMAPGTQPSGDLLVCTTAKRLGMDAAVGQWELHFARTKDGQGRTWADKINPQDLVVIQMMNHSGASGADGVGEMHTVMIGLVDSVTDTLAMNQRGSPERRIVVRGKDFGKFFVNGMVTYWNFLGAALLQAQKFVDLSRFREKPSRIIRNLLGDIFERFLRATVHVHGGVRELWDLLAYDLSSYDAEMPAGLDMKFISGEGSFWSFFVKVASPPFHELFIDTRRTATTNVAARPIIDKTNTTRITVKAVVGERETKAARFTLGLDRSAPTVVLRRTPFPYLAQPGSLAQQKANGLVTQDGSSISTVIQVTASAGSQDWRQLIRHEIGHDEEIQGEPLLQELSKSDHETYNMYLPMPSYPVLNERMMALSLPPVLDRARFHRYGYRPLTPQCTLMQPLGGQDTTETMFDFYTSLGWKLASWNVLNDRFLSGTKTLRLSPHLHIGERLVDRSSWHEEPMEFYIEGVFHRFIYGEGATTTVALTRGLSETDYARFDGIQSTAGRTPVEQQLFDPTIAGDLEIVPLTTVTQTFEQLIDTAKRVQH